ncbi:hypothetical protein VOLCADRAFT_107363 [Volvox carteri f. nagariensis]|uniref:Peptidase M28 domain-containing protein n=1 Tax=Volvox carteri f. nagariensis TaxID=3068 RepID=D8UDI2_VOLCA|nr:uncharacterized protein VOLCADRAFT_107363 [Volvox carteri f. nagariensis]EFJ42194.1 hypothetical protein VOLCADRAFT_107363 [Volvox carteri f. nagariensis]|eukprot:XP_002956737.1 hypothetical protein VOLCADRAFT_107363 [Volvox carteri f. nagariensis]
MAISADTTGAAKLAQCAKRDEQPIVPWASARLLFLGIILYYAAMLPLMQQRLHWNPPVRSASSPLELFSEERAMEHVKALAGELPDRQISMPQLRKAHDYIVRQGELLAEMAAARGGDVEVKVYRETVTGSVAMDFGGVPFTNAYRGLTNVVVTITPTNAASAAATAPTAATAAATAEEKAEDEGSKEATAGPEGAGGPPRRRGLLIASHHDSAVASPGASDDVSMVAVVLEVARAILSRPTSSLPAVPLVLLFDGGEESICQAGHGRGRTSHLVPAHGRLDGDVLGPGGEERSRGENCSGGWPGGDIFDTGIIPGDTDYRMFSARHFGSLPGLDIAFIRDSAAYHSHLDSVERLRKGALQGQTAAGVMRRMLAAAVRALGALVSALLAPAVLGVLRVMVSGIAMSWYANHWIAYASFLPLSLAAAVRPWLRLREEAMERAAGQQGHYVACQVYGIGLVLSVLAAGLCFIGMQGFSQVFAMGGLLAFVVGSLLDNGADDAFPASAAAAVAAAVAAAEVHPGGAATAAEVQEPPPSPARERRELAEQLQPKPSPSAKLVLGIADSNPWAQLFPDPAAATALPTVRHGSAVRYDGLAHEYAWLHPLDRLLGKMVLDAEPVAEPPVAVPPYVRKLPVYGTSAAGARRRPNYYHMVRFSHEADSPFWDLWVELEGASSNGGADGSGTDPWVVVELSVTYLPLTRELKAVRDALPDWVAPTWIGTTYHSSYTF